LIEWEVFCHAGYTDIHSPSFAKSQATFIVYITRIVSDILWESIMATANPIYMFFF